MNGGVQIMLEKLFKLSERKTNIRTELIAGITTFMTMAYILAVNPTILGASGMDSGAVFTATALASALATVLMGVLANLPFALSAGMGLNAFFAYTVVLGMGYSWKVALAAVFTEGIIFVILSLTNVREAIFNAIPKTLKVAASVGIGFFICFIGLQNAGIVVGDSSTLITMFSLSSSIEAGTFRTEGITVILAMVGILITAVLVLKDVKGNVLIGMIATWILGMICEALHVYVPDPAAGYYSAIPAAIVSMPASISSTFFKFDFSVIARKPMDFITVLFAFLFIDVFDTLGTLMGCATKADLLDENGKLPGIRGALLADSVGTIVGAGLGTSTITTFVESSAGVAEGGKTGLTSVFAGLMFLLALFFSPLFLAIPSFATAPALVLVGFMMVQQAGDIAWSDPVEAIPAFITITAMPFLYSISEGIALGIISFVLLNVFTGKKEKVSLLMYILAVIFLIKYIFL